MAFDIERFLDLTGYDTDTRKERRKNSEVNTQEFFTPYKIVEKMGNKIPEEDWHNPQKTFLEPCFGNGQFCCYIIWRRITAGVEPLQALKTLYGIELMEDNVVETKERVLDLLNQMNVSFDIDIAKQILDHNLRCSDFFNWDFRCWCPISKPLF